MPQGDEHFEESLPRGASQAPIATDVGLGLWQFDFPQEVEENGQSEEDSAGV